jgi:hypothetical protein
MEMSLGPRRPLEHTQTSSRPQEFRASSINVRVESSDVME